MKTLMSKTKQKNEKKWTAPEGSWASDEGTRKSMQGNKSRDTKPELRVRSLLHRQGLRYRVCQRPEKTIRRTADIVFRKAKIAVNIDGCFWHGCPAHYKEPTRNRDYWRTKIEINHSRDNETDHLLSQFGWTVLRFWEHEDPETVAKTIQEELRKSKAGDDKGGAFH